MKIIEFSTNNNDIKKIITRSRNDISNVREQVRPIIEDIKIRGDDAISDYLNKYDNISLKPDLFRIKKEKLINAYNNIDSVIRDSLIEREKNVNYLHKLQKLQNHQVIKEGIIAGEIVTPMDSAGLYVPGGTASFPTVAQILALPAKIAGVPRIIMFTPPGGVTDTVLATAYMSDVEEFYQIGGVAAIAAMAYGTETIKPTNIIVGPGNIYVTAAKLEVYGDVGIDMPAGPSEAIIIATPEAKPNLIAVDIMARAEHDPLAAAVVLCWDKEFASEINKSVTKMLQRFERKNIIKQAIAKYSAIIVVKNKKEAINFVNEYAPEHLEIIADDPFSYLASIRNAGSIFMGHYTPVAVGDYLGISNHVLPSTGYAKSFSPISTRTFQKTIQYEMLDKESLEKYNKKIMRPLAISEGFDAHLASIEDRLL